MPSTRVSQKHGLSITEQVPLKLTQVIEFVRRAIHIFEQSAPELEALFRLFCGLGFSKSDGARSVRIRIRRGLYLKGMRRRFLLLKI